jgi:hypothetical protein
VSIGSLPALHAKLQCGSAVVLNLSCPLPLADTCAPYFALGGSYKYKVFSSAIFQNGTSTVPASTFSVPSYCNVGTGSEALKNARCPKGSSVLGLNDGFPAEMKESVETARIFFGGRETA